MCQFRGSKSSVGPLLIIPERSPSLAVATTDVGVGFSNPDRGVIRGRPNSPTLVSSVCLQVSENLAVRDLHSGRPCAWHDVLFLCLLKTIAFGNYTIIMRCPGLRFS